MKICPSCRRTYTDQDLNFCLEDGSVLTIAGNVPAETMIMGEPRPTQPNPAFGGQQIQSTFDNQPKYSMQPKKSSKTWIWVLGIFAILILLCGGGFVGFLAYIGSKANNNITDGRTPTPRSTKSPGSATPDASPSASPFNSGDVQTVDLSAWAAGTSAYGTKEFIDGELVMGSKQKGFYYVLVAPAEYSTDSATTQVTARNVSDAATSMGLGLIFHSDPTPLTKDYAFLIDSKKKRYRVVRHEPEKETPVVAWTNSAAIKDGMAENVLEIRDKSGTTELYINGQMVTSIKNTYGHKGGVAGLYSGDGIKAAFKKLQISK